jgi:hypothetical protein
MKHSLTSEVQDEPQPLSILLALAERCEAATGPDRELDIAICVAIDWRYDDWEEGERTAREMAARHGMAWLVSRSVEGYNSTWRHLPRYTASLDAAMTLVPEGHKCGVTQQDREKASEQWWGELRRGYWTSYDKAFVARGATAALALCAAALRARANLSGESSHEG